MNKLGIKEYLEDSLGYFLADKSCVCVVAGGEWSHARASVPFTGEHLNLYPSWMWKESCCNILISRKASTNSDDQLW